MEKGYLVLCGANQAFSGDTTSSLKFINKNLVLFNVDSRAFVKELLEIVAQEFNGFKFYQIIATEPGMTLEEISFIKELGLSSCTRCMMNFLQKFFTLLIRLS